MITDVATTQMAEFIEARLSEVAAKAATVPYVDGRPSDYVPGHPHGPGWGEDVLRLLAGLWSDHPQYRTEWITEA